MNANVGHSKDELADPLKTVIESIVADKPDEVQMGSFLSSLKERPPIRSISLRAANSKPTRNRLLVTLASTAALVAILLGWQLLPTAIALEYIAKALANVQCIKATTVIDGKKSERWLVPLTNQTALRDDQKLEFADSQAGTLITYDIRTKELVQSLLPERRNSSMLVELVDLVESLAASGKGDVPKTIRGMAIQSAKIDSTGVHRVLHLNLLSHDGEMKGSATITLQENGDLPIAGVVNFSKGNLSQQIETTWEYPPTGPADIFELGVPPGTPVIDRIPTPAVKQLVADVYKGRLQFDDYRAVVFATNSEILHDIDAFEVSLVSKKANRLALLRNAARLPEFRGRSAADVAAELLKNPNRVKWQPATLIHGQDVYRFSMEIADGPVVNAKLSYRVSRQPNSPEFFTCPSSHRAPHLVGRPPTGVGSTATGASIISNQADGPKGCIQLRTVTTSHSVSGKSEQTDSNLGQGRVSDYWIDTTREALVIEYRTQMDDGSISTYALSELTRSPGGHWFPKIATLTNSVTLQNTIYRYFIEFSNPLPDTMFDPNQYVEASP